MPLHPSFAQAILYVGFPVVLQKGPFDHNFKAEIVAVRVHRGWDVFGGGQREGEGGGSCVVDSLRPQQ